MFPALYAPGKESERRCSGGHPKVWMSAYDCTGQTLNFLDVWLAVSRLIALISLQLVTTRYRSTTRPKQAVFMLRPDTATIRQDVGFGSPPSSFGCDRSTIAEDAGSVRLAVLILRPDTAPIGDDAATVRLAVFILQVAE